MLITKTPKTIRVMFTPFRDGLQSSFGGKVRLGDFLPAMEASAQAGIRHFEFGGGARYQAPYFYLGEDPFEDMRSIRDAVGPDADLQILTRSVSGVTLTTQSIEGLTLQAKLMHEYGTTWDRNFDYMNDVENLIRTGKPIVESGMHHQVCIALMGLPFHSDKVHTPEFYIDIGRRVLEGDVKVDSICLKDASGTTDPFTVYETARGLRKIMPPEMPLWQHTHDTASTAVSCYMAGIDGGVDGVDLSVRPMASGTVQPDVRSMAHALKGTGYSLDIDASKMGEIEEMLNDLMSEYAFNPATTTADARVLGFPMPGGAIGPNVHMMVKAGILDRYSEVLAEFPVVVEAGGAWTSVTPGSQQYWLQAFNNVLYGRWEKIDPGYGRAVLGYFGKTPLPPDSEVVGQASKQLDLPVFEGDPLEAAPKNVDPAREALKERGLDVTDKNTFLVLAAMVPGKKMEVNEG
ncbi:MAG: biotin attachment protein, partial [Planctomycetota bacterium]